MAFLLSAYILLEDLEALHCPRQAGSRTRFSDLGLAMQVALSESKQILVPATHLVYMTARRSSAKPDGNGTFLSAIKNRDAEELTRCVS